MCTRELLFFIISRAQRFGAIHRYESRSQFTVYDYETAVGLKHSGARLATLLGTEIRATGVL